MRSASFLERFEVAGFYMTMLLASDVPDWCGFRDIDDVICTAAELKLTL